MNLPWLTLLWLLPAVFGVVALAAGRKSLAWGRAAALGGAAAVFLYSLALKGPFDEAASAGTAWRLLESAARGPLGIRYALGLDGVALLLCWLNAFLTVVAIASSYPISSPPGPSGPSGGFFTPTREEEYPSSYFASFLFLEAAVMGVFLARDLFYFYVFWEAALIPMFFIIGLWGSDGRVKAAVKFIVYTVFGSLFLLVGILALVTLHHRTNGAWTWEMGELSRAAVGDAAPWIFAAMALGFAVKVPVWPLHNWLPDAHTEAPAAGSIMLAGVMLKMGVYGFWRVLIPILPDYAQTIAPWLALLGAFNILYGALCAMAQTDLKRMVAYSSVSHLGLCLLGLFAWNPQGAAGAAMQMINHGLSTGALFLLVGMLYARTHRRGIADFGELARRAPALTFFFALVLLSSIGLPGLNGFVGEALALAGVARVAPWLAAAGAFGAVLAAAYGLPAFQAVFWAPPGPGSASDKVADLGRAETALLASFAALIVALGVYPAPVLEILQPSVEALLR